MRNSVVLTTALAMAAAVPATLHAGDKPTDVEFKTVCGVSIPEETSRDTCLAVDYFHDGEKTQTDLNFPDFGMVLIWKPDNQVNVGSEGEDWGTFPYTTSEGETRFTVERITYYYISHKDLAARETGN